MNKKDIFKLNHPKWDWLVNNWGYILLIILAVLLCNEWQLIK